MLKAVCTVIALLASLPGDAAQAGEPGLVMRAAEWVWPQLQARVTLHAVDLARTPGGLGADALSGSGARGLRAGSLLGDYVFANHAYGSFRATSGWMMGGPGAVPGTSLSLGSKLSVSVQDNPWRSSNTQDPPQAVPYLGFGYSSGKGWRRLSLSADFGLVADSPLGQWGGGRAIFGHQGLDNAVREMRLAPMLHLGLRYTF